MIKRVKAQANIGGMTVSRMMLDFTEGHITLNLKETTHGKPQQ